MPVIRGTLVHRLEGSRHQYPDLKNRSGELEHRCLGIGDSKPGRCSKLALGLPQRIWRKGSPAGGKREVHTESFGLTQNRTNAELLSFLFEATGKARRENALAEQALSVIPLWKI
jgi:hypothetical protein